MGIPYVVHGALLALRDRFRIGTAGDSWRMHQIEYSVVDPQIVRMRE